MLLIVELHILSDPVASICVCIADHRAVAQIKVEDRVAGIVSRPLDFEQILILAGQTWCTLDGVGVARLCKD